MTKKIRAQQGLKGAVTVSREYSSEEILSRKLFLQKTITSLNRHVQEELRQLKLLQEELDELIVLVPDESLPEVK